MSRVLLLASTTGYQIRSFGDAAGRMDIDLVLASDRCDQLEDPWWDSAIPVRFHDVPRSVSAIVASVVDAQPDGVIAVGDRPVVLAAHAAVALGRRGNAPDAAAISVNKRATRERLRQAGLLVPSFRSMRIDASFVPSADLPFPLVVKPTVLSGSRGVMRVDTAAEIDDALARLRRLLQAPDVRAMRDAAFDEVLVETFIPGPEYAVEGVLTGGAFHPFAIFDKPDPLEGPFFEETIYVTPSRTPEATQARIIDAVSAAAAAIGLTQGPIHAECRVNDGGVYVLEVAARPIGGLCSKALRFARDGQPEVSLESVLLRHAVGEDVRGFRRESAASGVMMIPIPRRGVYRGVHGIDEAHTVQGVEDIRITAKLDAALVPLPEGRSYLGFIFARAETPQAVERALRDAHGRLRFTIDREVNVV